MSKILILQTDEKRHIGFIMFAGEGEPFRDKDWNGECIFTGVPNETETFDHPLCRFIYDIIHKEYNARILNDIGVHKLVISSNNTIVVQAKIADNKKGIWQVHVGEAAGKKGICIIPPKKKADP